MSWLIERMKPSSFLGLPLLLAPHCRTVLNLHGSCTLRKKKCCSTSYRGGVDNDNWFFPVFVEPQAFLRQKYEDATIAFALEERQLACFGRQPRSGDGHRELERQKQFSPDTMITMK